MFQDPSLDLCVFQLEDPKKNKKLEDPKTEANMVVH